MDVFTPGSHGSTFGGNPLAAAVGLEALRVIRDEGLVEKSRVLGAHMLERLRAIKSPALKEVRGRGLWAGAEIDPAIASAREACERLLDEGRAVEGDARHGRSFGAAADHRARGSRLGARSLRGSHARARRHAAAAGRGLTFLGTEAMTTLDRPSARFLMCRPEHFAVSYAINPWMDPQSWASDERAHAARVPARMDRAAPHARPSSARRSSSFRRVPGAAGSRLHRQRRRGARPPGAAGALPPSRAPARGSAFRGRVPLAAGARPGRCRAQAAGACRARRRRRLRLGPLAGACSGWAMGRVPMPPRAAAVEDMFGRETIALELADQRFYHMDTALRPLPGGEVMYVPEAFTPAGRTTIRRPRRAPRSASRSASRTPAVSRPMPSAWAILWSCRAAASGCAPSSRSAATAS